MKFNDIDEEKFWKELVTIEINKGTAIYFAIEIANTALKAFQNIKGEKRNGS